MIKNYSHRSFFQYVSSSIIVSLLSGIYVIIDGIFIGKYIGDDGLSAINIAWPITSFIQTIGLAIGIGGGIIYSIYEGMQEEKLKNKTEFITFITLIILSLILCLILFFLRNSILRLFGAEGIILEYGSDYLKIIIGGALFQVMGMGLSPLIRNKGKVKEVMFAMIIGTFINLLGDYLLIVVFPYKLVGAAFASVLGQMTTGLICLIILLKNREFIPNFNKEIFFKILRNSFSPFILTFSASILLIITNLICLKYGGNSCVATYTIYSYIIYIIQMNSQGFNDGSQPLLSYYYGAQDDKNLRKTVFKLYLSSTISTVLVCLLILIFRNMIIQLFDVSETTTNYYYSGFISFFVGLIFINYVKINCGYLYATKRLKEANILVILEPLVITPIFLLFLPKLIGIEGIWLAFSLSEILIAIIGIFIIFIKKSLKKV